MFTVTAICNGMEVGHGEGEGYQYAMEEAVESIPKGLFEVDDVVLVARNDDGMTVETQLRAWYWANVQ